MKLLVISHPLEKRFLYCLLFLLFILFLILNLLSEGSYGGADDIGHYRFARYAIKYPPLYLDQWAKPLFTLLASPFAQLGYWGVRLFNVTTGTLTAYFLYKITILLKIRHGWILPVLLFFIPVYTSMLLSGMTEILFGLALVLAVYFVLKEEFVWSAVILSLLPMARTEGIVLWPVFIIIYFWKKQWKALPFLLTGSLIYTLAGGFYFDDFLCLFTQMPYTGTYDIYGHGDLLHFVKATKSIFGIPETILFGIGVLAISISFIKNRDKKYLYEILLILAPICIFYAAHSYVWWKGINSLGLIRVMACISPLFAIFSLRGVNLIADFAMPDKPRFKFLTKPLFGRIPIKKFIPFLKITLLCLVFYLIIATPFRVYTIPVPLPQKELLVKDAADWFGKSPFKDRKFYIWEPYFWFFLGIESYNTPKMADGIPNREHPEIGVLPGEIVIWDAHFSAVDGRFPFENIASNPYFKLVKAVIPKREILVFGHPYKMGFFERLDTAGNHNNYAILDSFTTAALPKLHTQFKIFDNFDDPNKNRSRGELNSIDTFSGKYCLHISSNLEYYDFIRSNVKTAKLQEFSRIRVSMQVKQGPVNLIISLKHRRNIYYYLPTEIKYNHNWSPVEVTAYLPLPKGNMDNFNVYIWNQNKKEVYIDDVCIEIMNE